MFVLYDTLTVMYMNLILSIHIDQTSKRI